MDKFKLEKFRRQLSKMSYCVDITKKSSTVDVIDDFERSKKRFLVISNFCYFLYNTWEDKHHIPCFRFSLVAERCASEVDAYRFEKRNPSISDLKSSIGKSFWSSNWESEKLRPSKEEASFPLLKLIYELPQDQLFDGNVIALSEPFLFQAQNSSHRSGFGMTAWGKRWYGIHHVFKVVGLIISKA